MFQFKSVQRLPIDIQQAWSFFSSPANLAIITPPELDFVVKTELPAKMYAGMFITYSVRPMFGIPVTWVTEITQVDESVYFVDEQRVGPYAIWHHQHFFKEIPGGVEMTDIVDYKLPMGALGNLVHGPIVKPKLTQIFNYRQEKLVELFGTYKETTANSDIPAST